MSHPTFDQFVNEMFMYIFDGLISGGTKEMKNRLMLTISSAAQISSNGGFSKQEK